jgi:hypothetical protein
MCNKFKTTSIKVWSSIAHATYIWISSTRWRIVTGASQVKQEGCSVCFAPLSAPVLTGIAANTITVRNLKQAHSSFLVITQSVKIFVFPAIIMARVKSFGDSQGLTAWKHRGEGLVLEKELVKEGSHFIWDFASCIGEEGFIHGSYHVCWRSWLLSTELLRLLKLVLLNLFLFFLRLDLLYLL